MADNTRKNRDASLFAWVLLLLWVSASVSERDQAEQDQFHLVFHLVNATHPAINAQPAESLTGTYNNLSKHLRGNPG